MTGSLPPDVCGVGDYSDALIRSLRAETETLEIFYVRNWSLRTLFVHASRLRRYGSGVLNVQYPTQGYGWSLVPMVLCLLVKPRRSVITLHEFSNRSIKAKCASYVFFLFASWFIFTTQHEFDSCCRIAPWIKSRSSVIPLASNIPMRSGNLRDIDIAYFGHIRPDKGLEEFISVITSIRTIGRFRVTVIGQLVDGFEDYAADIIGQLKSIDVDITLNSSAEHVSQLLSRTRVALLPFPDGMSLRRGTALASMGNGALLVTRASTDQNSEFDHVCVGIPPGIEISEVLLRVLYHYEEYESIRVAGETFARSFSWKNIAVSYIEILKKVSA